MENIVLTFIDRTHCIDSTYSFQMVNSQFTFVLDGKEVSSNANIWETLGLAMLFLFLVFAGFMITAAVLGYEIGYLFDVFATLQIVHLFPVARLYLPTGLFKFFQSFEKLNFISLSVGLWQFKDFIDSSLFVNTGTAASYNFKKMGFTTRSFIDTSSDVLLCIVYMSFIPVIIQSLRMLLYNSTMVKNIQRNTLKSFLPILVYVTCTILLFTSVMNFIVFDVKSNTESTGTFAAYGYILFISVFLIALFALTISFWWSLRQQAKQGATGELGDDDLRQTTFRGSVFFYWFRTNNFMHYFYPCFFIIRRIFISIILNLLKLDGFTQLLLLGLLSVVSLVWFTSYQPFRSRVRNVWATINEVAYLSVWMTIFPYVYPDLEDQDFESMATVVVGFFISIMAISMIVSSAFVIAHMIKNKKKQPIFANKDGVVLQGQSNEDLRHLWTQGVQPPHSKDDKKGKLQEDLAQNEAVKALDEKGPKINEKGGLESAGSQTENDDSEDSESESASESQSEASQSEMGNPEIYGQERNIIGAEVNLMETGFSTGMSKLREAQIQQYREKEKQMF